PRDLGIQTPGGKVGIGMPLPVRKLHVLEDGIFSARFETSDPAASVVEFKNGSSNATWEYGVSGSASTFGLRPGSMYIFKQGLPGPSLSIDPSGNARMAAKLSTNGFDPDSGYPVGIAGGLHTWDVYAEGLVGVGQNGSLNAFMRNDGVAAFKIVQITGADFSEKFKVRDTQTKIEPGMVVAIDPENAGKLVVSAKAYDRRVAGILSGAGGITTGMLMGQPGTLADGDHAVALTGRVYVWADASKGPI